jgi:hypothetical protein
MDGNPWALPRRSAIPRSSAGIALITWVVVLAAIILAIILLQAGPETIALPEGELTEVE